MICWIWLRLRGLGSRYEEEYQTDLKHRMEKDDVPPPAQTETAQKVIHAVDLLPQPRCIEGRAKVFYDVLGCFRYFVHVVYFKCVLVSS